MSDEVPHCHKCGEIECDLTRCADCGGLFCDECLDWSGEAYDEQNGDWFCHDCQ